MPLAVAADTDIGRLRSVNQDAVHAATFRDGGAALLIVADGLGGHAAGEVASRSAVETIAEAVAADLAGNGRLDTDPAAFLRALVEDTNASIYVQAAGNPNWAGMGTTLVAAWISHDQVTVAHVGDSRAYCLHDGTLVQLTTDHSWVEAEVRAGRLRAEAARSHPRRHIVLRSLGTGPALDVDVLGPVPFSSGDRLLLCTDGLHGVIPDDESAAILGGYAPTECVVRLLAAANDAGGPDNIGVAVGQSLPPA
ncbi:MAG: PP2C family serine/threonine-protein phosphatase [Dehalococcoidia bacterium]